MKIDLPNPSVFLERGVDIPGSLWKNPPFKFDPHPFALQSPRLQEKIYDPSVQTDSYQRFLDSPFEPIVYGVASAPDEIKAKLFAAHLVYKFIKATTPLNSILWVTSSLSVSNGNIKTAFDKRPSLLVITGLTPNNTNYKLDLVHELVEHHSNIPRILVIAGEDPITFIYERLHLPVNSVFFSSAAVVKRKVEVI
jgi:hypothetical protein